MPLRSTLQTARRPSLRRVLLAVGALLLLGAVGATAFDHPAAQAGLGQRDWSAFSTVTDADEAYTVVVAHASEDGGDGLVVRYSQYANGSYVETVTPTDGAATLPSSPLTRRAAVQLDDGRYERETHRPGSDPATLEPHVYVDGKRTVVERGEDGAGSFGATYATGVERLLASQVYVAAGRTTRNGTTFTRYDVLGHRDAVRRLIRGDGLTGYVLVDDAGRVRYAELRNADGPGAVVTYRAIPDAQPTVPSWVATARAKLETASARPELRAYRRGGRVLLVTSAQWTPARETTVALLDGTDDVLATVRVPGGEPVFQRRGADTYVAVLTPTADGVALSANRSGTSDGWEQSPERVVVDRAGRNLYDVPVEPGARLGSVASVVAAHLRPRNGGGRVLRVDGLQFGTAVEADTPVTVTVGNETASRSLTVLAGNLSGDRFYLLRTTDGLEVRTVDGIAVHVRPATRFADRRFVEDARLRVTANGLPVVTRRVPRRATQAGVRPLSRLLTGVSITTADEPPDRSLLGQGPELRASNWTGYTFVAVHSWDYDALYVRGGTSVLHPDVVHEDETHYYRASDGATFWVETPNGTRLYTGTANGANATSR